MATTLWDKFQAAIVWILDTSVAGVRAVATAPISSSPAQLLDGVDTTIDPPQTITDGVDVRGLQDVTLTFAHSTKGNTSTITLHLYDGQAWRVWGTVDLDDTVRTVLDPFAVRGMHRVAISGLAADIGPGDGSVGLSIWVTPHREAV